MVIKRAFIIFHLYATVTHTSVMLNAYEYTFKLLFMLFFIKASFEARGS